MGDGVEGRLAEGLHAPLLLQPSRGREPPMPAIVDVETGEGEGEDEAAPPTQRTERSTDNGGDGSGFAGPSKKQARNTTGVVLSWSAFLVFMGIDMALWTLGLTGPAAVVLLCAVLPAMVAPPALCTKIARFWCCF